MTRLYQAGLGHSNSELDAAADINPTNLNRSGVARIGYVPPDPSTVVVIELADRVVTFLS